MSNEQEKINREFAKYPWTNRTFFNRPHWTRRRFFEIARRGRRRCVPDPAVRQGG